jgi:hypothetical protein
VENSACRTDVPPAIAIRPSWVLHAAFAADSTPANEAPVTSASRLASASATEAYETPTRASTV